MPPVSLFGPLDLPLVVEGAQALLRARQYPQCVPDHSVTLIYPGESVDLPGLRVDVGRAFHPLDARAYRFTDTESGASIVFTGDTAYHEALPEFARDCDVLVHEASSQPGTDLRSRQRVLHSTPEDAARVANEANVGELVLVHYPDAHKVAILETARAGFPDSQLGIKGARLTLQSPGHNDWSYPEGSGS